MICQICDSEVKKLTPLGICSNCCYVSAVPTPQWLHDSLIEAIKEVNMKEFKKKEKREHKIKFKNKEVVTKEKDKDDRNRE